LALHLRDAFASLPRLESHVPETRRTQGIIPGKLGEPDVLDAPEDDAEPYLAGWEDMAPFFLPWQLHARWIRYSSRRLWRARRDYEWLFRSTKVLVTRQTTWDRLWRVRAAVDHGGLFPSHAFIAIAPEEPLTAACLGVDPGATLGA
jgi:hypothetical protein